MWEVSFRGKLFEYMGANRPIICIGTADGDASRILSESEAAFIIDFDDEESLINTLRKCFGDYESSNLKSNAKNIDRYSRDQLAGKYADLLNEVLISS